MSDETTEQRAEPWQAIYDAVSDYCGHTGGWVEPLGCMDCVKVADAVIVPVARRLAAVEAERDSLGANVDRLENNALKDSLDRWKTEAREMGKYSREAADTLARALGYPDAQHAGLPIGSVVLHEVTKLAAAELVRLTTENQRLADSRRAVTELIGHSQPMQSFGGHWSNGIISVDELCAALSIVAPDPTPQPMTDEERAEVAAALAEIRTEREAAGHPYCSNPNCLGCIVHPGVPSLNGDPE